MTRSHCGESRGGERPRCALKREPISVAVSHRLPRASQNSPAQKRPQHCSQLCRGRLRSSSSEAAYRSAEAARRRAAPSRSITARQPGLTCARFLTMQAVIRWTLGTSWPHSRMASPVHICCASEKARPGRAESVVAARAIAKRSAVLLVRWIVIEPFPKGCVQGCVRCWPLFIGGAARGLRCRTRRPSPGTHPSVVARFLPMSESKSAARPHANYAPMLRTCNGSLRSCNGSH